MHHTLSGKGAVYTNQEQTPRSTSATTLILRGPHNLFTIGSELSANALQPVCKGYCANQPRPDKHQSHLNTLYATTKTQRTTRLHVGLFITGTMFF